MQARYGEQGFVVVAVGVDGDVEESERFLAKVEPGFQIVLDPRAELARMFDLEGMPSTFIYGRDGQLRVEHIGFRDADRNKLESTIVSLLQEKGATQ